MDKPEIRIKDIDSHWTKFKMSDVIKDMYNGQTPYRGESSYWNGDINWISSGDLNRGIVLSSTEKITKEGQKSANLRLVPKGTMVIAITGLEAAGTRGNCGILGIDTTMNQSCMALFPDNEHLITPFLFQWYRKYSEELGIKLTQGTKQQSYNASIIKDIELNLPLIEEQKVISNILTQFDKQLYDVSKRILSLRQMKAASLQSMYPKKGENKPQIRFKGFDEPWEEKSLNDCLEISTERNTENKYGIYPLAELKR